MILRFNLRLMPGILLLSDETADAFTTAPIIFVLISCNTVIIALGADLLSIRLHRLILTFLTTERLQLPSLQCSASVRGDPRWRATVRTFEPQYIDLAHSARGLCQHFNN